MDYADMDYPELESEDYALSQTLKSAIKQNDLKLYTETNHKLRLVKAYFDLQEAEAKAAALREHITDLSKKRPLSDEQLEALKAYMTKHDITIVDRDGWVFDAIGHPVKVSLPGGTDILRWKDAFPDAIQSVEDADLGLVKSAPADSSS